MDKSAQFIPVFDSSSRSQFIAAFKSSVTPSFVFGLPFNRVCEDDTMIKNVANQVVDFLLLSTTDGSAVTTGTPAVYYKGDGGTQTIGTGMISHKGLGEWEYTPVQAETNFNHIVFLATLAGAFSQAVNIYTKAGDAYTAVAALNNISSSDVNAACDTALSDYGANTVTPPTVSEIRAEIDLNSTKLSAIVEDTGTAIPTQITGVSSLITALNNFDPVTDTVAVGKIIGTSLTETSAGYLAAGLSYFFDVTVPTKTINDCGVSGTGLSAGDVWGYTTRTLTAGTKDSEIDSILEDTGTIIPNQISALNIISSSDVSAACDAALLDYGANTTTPPTVQEIRAEIDAYSTQLSTLATRLTATRAGYIDKLNVTGTLANSDTAALYQTSLTGIATSTEIASIDTLIDAIKQVTDKLSDTLEDDAGTYRFTTNALEQAPSGTIANAASIADAVWDELLSEHTVAGSSGNALATASSGGVDPAVLADAIWDEAISGHTTAGTFGAKNQKLVPSETIGDYVGSGGDATEANQTTIIGHLTAIKGTTFSGSTDSLEAIRNQGDSSWVTGTLPSVPTAEAIRTEIDNNSTKLPTIITHLNDIKGTTFTGATDSLEALRNQGDAAWVTGVFPTIPTAVAIREELDSHSTQLSLLVSRLTALRAGYLDKLNVSGTLAHSDAASIYKADISGLATAVALAAVDTVVDSVKVYTDTLPSIQAAIEAAITDAHVSTDALLTSISADTSTDIPTLIAALHDPDTASIAAAVLDGVLTDLTDNSLNSGQTITLRKAIRAVFNRFFREVTQTASTQIVKNDAGSQVAVMTVSDDATTQTKGSAS